MSTILSADALLWHKHVTQEDMRVWLAHSPYYGLRHDSDVRS